MMTAGSESGMNLIDVANTYKKIMGNVPELIAIYYTSRMLRHLESLHEDGKVLHCDVKPDNWVLTPSQSRDAVGGCDLMLCDFGRAIDLEKVTRQGEDPLRTLFKGSIAAEDMECGTMREGLPWGVDLDYFGLCASAFILLFGSHMEVVRDKSTGNWRLNKILRRYWQKDLWQSLFHSLLNFDLGSERKCLRDLRVAFDEYIDEDRSREIATHLNQLFTHLPKKR
jgi:checkpoint serine/threonine-protein kinase